MTSDFDTCPPGTLKTLCEKEMRIAELEADNRSLQAKLVVVEYALQLMPGQFDLLMESAASLIAIFKGDSDD